VPKIEEWKSNGWSLRRQVLNVQLSRPGEAENRIL